MKIRQKKAKVETRNAYLLALGNPSIPALVQPGRKHDECVQGCVEVALSSMADKRDHSLHKRTRGSWRRPELTGAANHSGWASPRLREPAAVRRSERSGAGLEDRLGTLTEAGGEETHLGLRGLLRVCFHQMLQQLLLDVNVEDCLTSSQHCPQRLVQERLHGKGRGGTEKKVRI